MPLALILRDGPGGCALVSGETDDALLAALGSRVALSPPGSVEEAQRWLCSLPAPSGWYVSASAARAALAQALRQDDMSGADLAAIRGELGLPRARFAEALGFQGSDNTRHKQIWEMEKGRKPILPERARLARTLLALARLEGTVPAAMPDGAAAELAGPAA